MQFFLFFLLLIFWLAARHFYRNRQVYSTLLRFLTGLSREGNVGNNYSDYGKKDEKRIVSCPHCGSNPEVTSEPCSKCGRYIDG